MKGLFVKNSFISSKIFLCLIICFYAFYSQLAEAAISFVNSDNGSNVGGGAGITFVASSSATSATTNTLTITLPAGTAVDDVMVAQVTRRGGGLESFTAPAGWTQIGSDLHIPTGGTGGNSHKHRAYYKVATAADLTAGNATWTFADNRNNVGGISSYTNVDTVNPIHMNSENGQTANTNTIDATGFTTTVDGAMLIAFYGINANLTFTGPAGYTQRYNQLSTNIKIMSADLLQATAGATGTVTTTLSGNNDRRVGRLIALNPAANSLTIAVPTGTAVDDVMIAAIAVRPSSIVIGAPSGWTLELRTDQGAGNSNSQAIYYRVAGSSEPASYTWSFSGGTHTGAVGGILSYSGVDTTSPIDVSGGNTTVFGTSHTANSVTTTVADAMLVSTHSYSSAQNWTPPGGMTEQVDVFSTAAPSGGGIAIEMNDELLTAAGATGSRTAVADASADTGVTHMIALTPLAISGNITATFSANINAINAGSISITNAALGDPEATATNTNTGSAAITTLITTLTNNAWLIDTVGSGNGGTFTPGGLQTERWDTSIGSATAAMSTKGVATAGPDSMSQTHSTTSNRNAHTVIAVAPADSFSTIAFDAVASTNDTTTNTINWPHTLITTDTANVKLIVGIGFEEAGACNDTINSVTYGNIPLTQVAQAQVNSGGGAGTCQQVEIWYADLNNIIVSTNNNSTLGGQPIDQDEAVEYDVLNDTGTLFFDEATFDNNETLDAIHQLNSGNLAISTGGGASIGGNAFLDGDIVEVTPSGTAGIFDYVGILFAETNFTSGSEDVDAVYVRDNGNIILSTTGPATLPGVGNFQDDDLVEWDPATSTATMFLDESAEGNLIPNAVGDEDIDGVHLINDDSNLILFSLASNNTILGTAVLDGDVILYNRNTSSASIYFDEGNFSGGEDVDALTLAIPVGALSIDHYDIDFSSVTGITCLPVSVTITAKNFLNATINHLTNTTINLSTNTSLGSWVSVTTGTGTLTDITLGDGLADYQFPSGESTVTIVFNYTTLGGSAPETVNINITSTPNETTGIADTDDDPDVDFSLAGFIYNNITAGNNTIPTQISGKDSDTGFGAVTLNIQAVRTSDDDPTVCVSIFANGDVETIELGAECKDPNTCAGLELNIKNINLPASGQDIDTSDDDGGTRTVASQEGVDLEFGANSAATIVLNYPDAGSLQLHARYELLLDDGTPSGDFAIGISNTFVERPFGFDIDSGGLRAADWLDNNALDDSTGTNLSYAADADGSVFASAGHSTNTFSVTLRAVVWESADDDGVPSGTADDGVPDTGANLTDNSTTPNFGQEATTELVDVTSGNVQPTNVGSLFFGDNRDFSVNSVASGLSGTLTTNLAFDEVGIMDLTAALDTGDYLSGGADVTSTHQNFGRFIPDRFTLADNTPTFENSCVAGSFTYMEESFYYGTGNEPAITVTAVNENGDTTVNYGDGGTSATDYWKLPTALTRAYDDNSVNNGTTFNDLAVASVGVTGDNNYDGIGIFTLSNTVLDRDSFMFDRSTVDLATEGGPFTASIDLLIQVTAGSLTDTDGVCYDGDGDGTCEIDGSDDYTALTDTGGTALSLNELRFGRFNIGTAVGSELLTLTPSLMTEYFDGTGFVLNADDSCTAIDLADHIRLDNTGTPVQGTASVTIGGGTTSITTFNSPLVSGDTGTVFSAPGAGNTGFVDIIGNLGCNDVTVICAGSTTFDHLRYDWDDDDGNDDGPYDDEPSGRIDFGVFEGPNEFIYIREPW